MNASSKKVRVAAELAIETSGLDYTVLRPTMIYGTSRDRNMWRLIKFMRVSPIVPIFGDGLYLQQPIFVDDVAAAVLGCLKADVTIGKSYNIAGRHPLTYNEVIDTIARATNTHIWKVHIPSKPVVSLLGLFERIKIPFPIKAEQVFSGWPSFFSGTESPFAEQFVFGQDMQLDIRGQPEIKTL